MAFCFLHDPIVDRIHLTKCSDDQFTLFHNRYNSRICGKFFQKFHGMKSMGGALGRSMAKRMVGTSLQTTEFVVSVLCHGIAPIFFRSSGFPFLNKILFLVEASNCWIGSFL